MLLAHLTQIILQACSDEAGRQAFFSLLIVHSTGAVGSTTFSGRSRLLAAIILASEGARIGQQWAAGLIPPRHQRHQVFTSRSIKPL